MSQSLSTESSHAFENGPDLVEGHSEVVQELEVIPVIDSNLLLKVAYAVNDASVAVSPDKVTPSLVIPWVSKHSG